MKIYLEKAIFVNKPPFQNSLELDFFENEIAVLSAINGRGKTTIISFIVDAFYEMAKRFYEDITENVNSFYRISSNLENLDRSQPSFVYLRFKSSDGQNIDYVNIRELCTEDQYNFAVKLVDKIPFSEILSELNENGLSKKISNNFNKKNANTIFEKNVITSFPSYRFEIPGYLNDPQKIKLEYTKISRIIGQLRKPVEVITGLPDLANWIIDVILDLQYQQTNPTKNILDLILSCILISKGYGNVRFGVGPRNFGSTRIQIVNVSDKNSIYPSIFNLSSGESSLLCLFGEILRQADLYNMNIDLNSLFGIVVIDEVDKHLHIKLQKEVLPRLFRIFPNVQFIVSSHSPFLNVGLAQSVPERARIIDIENNLSIQPMDDPQYQEVYEMMVSENERFKQMYESINSQIEDAKELQIITEGKNTEHIEKAISILDNDLLQRIKIIKGCEGKSGDQQLKNTFEVMSKAKHLGRFLFVWDCDSQDKICSIVEEENFFKFCFERNLENNTSEKGIENLYPETLFTDEVYNKKESKIDYGGRKVETVFSKNKFLEKIKGEHNADVFENYKPLIEKIISILSDNSAE